jgi:hypothetical protein
MGFYQHIDLFGERKFWTLFSDFFTVFRPKKPFPNGRVKNIKKPFIIHMKNNEIPKT